MFVYACIMNRPKGQLPAFGKINTRSKAENKVNSSSTFEITNITRPLVANTDNIPQEVAKLITKASQMGMNTQDIIASITSKAKQPTRTSFGKPITKPTIENPKIILSNKLSFYDYKGSKHEFNLA